MKTTLFKKEFLYFFYSPLGFIFLAVFLLLANFLFFNNFFLINDASTRGYFSTFSLMLVFLAPALSMRSFAEEKSSGTQEILFTLPLRDWHIIFSKFMANMAFLLLALFLTLPVPISISFIGQLDWGEVAGGYLGVFLLGGLYLAIGLYVSRLTSQQMSAFLMTLFVVLLLFLSGQAFVLEKVPSGLASILDFVSPVSHFNNMAKGLVDIRDLLYFLSFSFYFLFALVKNLTLRRYKR